MIADEQNAVVANAKVTIKQVETGAVQTSQSKPDGHYVFPLLVPGHYDVKVEHDGFETKITRGVIVLTGNASVADIVLHAGAVNQTIDVSAETPLVQTESSTISKVIENETVVDMPLLDRRASQLQRLSGFVVGSNSGSSATFSIAGGRGGNANYLIDGGTAQNLLQGVPTLSFDPPIEALQEFNLALSNYEAELGRSGGGVLQMTTRSGTNHFHGSAYEYIRNDAIQATPYFATTKPRLRYNLFGASFSGPIIRDRTHFFFTYEGRRSTKSTTVTANVPTAAERAGDFSAFSTVVTNPYTGLQAVGDDGTLNKLPSSVLDPVGVKLAAFFPNPNVSGAAANTNNYRVNDPTTAIVNAYTGRIDHIIGPNDRLYGHFLAQVDTSNTTAIFPTPGTDSYGNRSDNYYYNELATWIHNFSPSVINELRVTFTQRKALAYSLGANTALADQVGLKGTDASFFPTVTLSGLATLGYSQQERLQVPILSDEYTDHVTFVRGKHQFKAGVEWRTSKNSDVYRPSAGGAFGFTNLGVSSSTALGSLANLLMGRVNSGTLNDTLRLNTTAYGWAAFFQDDWRITPRLVLNLGVRYDVDTPRWEDQNRQNSFDPTTLNPVSGTPGVITFSGRNGLTRYAHQWDLNNVGPRLGFSYKVDDNTVVRGGGAILYPGEYDQATPIVAYTGFSKSISLTSTDTVSGTPAFLLKNNATDGTGKASVPTDLQLNSSFGAVTVGSQPTQAPDYFNRNRITGYIYQSNLNVQRQITPTLLVEVGYLGSFGHHLSATSSINTNQVAPDKMVLLATTSNKQTLRPFPQFNNVSILAKDYGASSYNGLNIGIQRRAKSGLQFGANYTWSKYIDNVDARSNVGQTSGTITDYYHPAAWRGLSANDVRNRLIANALYNLPFGRGKLVNVNSRWLDEVVGGWTLGGIFEIHSGSPLEVYDATNNTGTYSGAVRPNLTSDPNAVAASRSRNDKISKWFNTAAFTANANYTFGNAPRSFGSGPGTTLLDASLLKEFALVKSTKLQFRAEALNVLNHANLANPNTTFGNSAFGTISALQAGDNQSRVLQFALHLAF
ncbi:MAG: TonB-dependent receptor [Acidobacteriaceae bacterium]|nr:TonB-dependent receptor [Acidobacteriaceae bacterium]